MLQKVLKTGRRLEMVNLLIVEHCKVEIKMPSNYLSFNDHIMKAIRNHDQRHKNDEAYSV